MPGLQWTSGPPELQFALRLWPTGSAPGGQLLFGLDGYRIKVSDREDGCWQTCYGSWEALDLGERMEFAPGHAAKRVYNRLIVWHCGHRVGWCGWWSFALMVGMMEGENERIAGEAEGFIWPW